ncbi:arsenate reductase ArsC [Haliea sp. E17]|uniref:arsenate reductase ArsC n=1 Tax=Haliea sp. E17 TaxID=3401576 RepID=UPI003AAD0C92
MTSILYICTHNRCRSILSEALTNHLAGGRLRAFSAGSQPAGEVHPLTLKFLAERGIATAGLASQSWDDFEAEQPDIVVTVCDSAANETCPVWFGTTAVAHWGLPDPSKLEGDEATVRQAFNAVMDTIEQRVGSMLAVNWESLSRDERQRQLDRLTEE